MSTQLNVRLPDPTIDRINELVDDYGSQAKVIIAAVENLHTKEKEMKMSRQYYAGYNSYGTSFTYDSDGWSVHVFNSKSARDQWVGDDKYPDGNPTRESVTLKTAKKMQPDSDHWIEES